MALLNKPTLTQLRMANNSNKAPRNILLHPDIANGLRNIGGTITGGILTLYYFYCCTKKIPFIKGLQVIPTEDRCDKCGHECKEDIGKFHVEQDQSIEQKEVVDE